MDPTLQILFILYQHGFDGVSAKQIAAELNCPLDLTLETIESLRQCGCVITESAGKLFLEQTALTYWRDILENPPLRLHIKSAAAVYASTASTNDLCWNTVGNLANARISHGLVVVANHQTAGRGRRGNHWVAKPGQSVLMSVFLCLSPPEKTEHLTLLAGLATARGIELALNEKIKTTIKWPNDVHINGKKVAGVLAEGRAMGNELSVVVGIGVNASQTASDFPPELRDRATSCYLATGRHPDRVRIVESILNCLDEYTGSAQGANWISNWKSRCEMFGKRFLFESAGKRLDAEIIDIDPERGLIVRDAAGAMHFLQSATTTIIPQ